MWECNPRSLEPGPASVTLVHTCRRTHQGWTADYARSPVARPGFQAAALVYTGRGCSRKVLNRKLICPSFAFALPLHSLFSACQSSLFSLHPIMKGEHRLVSMLVMDKCVCLPFQVCLTLWVASSECVEKQLSSTFRLGSVLVLYSGGIFFPRSPDYFGMFLMIACSVFHRHNVLFFCFPLISLMSHFLLGFLPVKISSSDLCIY